MPGTNACRSATAGDTQLVLRVPDPLLELPAVALGLTALESLQLRAGGVELLLRTLRVDLARLDGVVDERERAVLLDLEESRPGRELDHLRDVAVAVDARRARLQHRHERRVPR